MRVLLSILILGALVWTAATSQDASRRISELAKDLTYTTDKENVSLEQGLAKLKETSQALLSFDSDNTVLKELLTRAVSDIQRIQEIASTSNSAQSGRHLTSRHYSPHAKHHHWELHNALQAGDIGSIVDRYSNQAAGRRLEYEIDEDDSDDEEDQEGAEQECKALVTCLREWTLLDVVSFFFVDEEGNIIKEESSQDQLYAKAKRIAKRLSVFPLDEIDETTDLGPKCNALLSVFDETDSWKEICQAPKVLSLEDIGQAFGPEVAQEIFQDFVVCLPEDITQDVFFDNDHHHVQLPASYKNDTTELEFQRLDSLYQRVLVQEIGEGNITLGASEDCQAQLDQVYKQLFFQDQNKPSPYLGSREDDSLPDLVLECNSTFVGGIQTYSSCRIQVEDYESEELDDKCQLALMIQPEAKLCSDIEEKPMEGTVECRVELGVPGLFQTDVSDLQQAAQLLLGEEVSLGQVCRHEGEAPGFCCLDQPEDDFSLGLWGGKFNCDLDESECQNLAPLLSGFSEETCTNRYEGTYCLKPTNCTDLMECVQDEKEWAKENDKNTYFSYLDAAPHVEGVGECGMLREYFGFAEDREDREVCDGIRQLRSNSAFDKLDKMAEDHPRRPANATIGTNGPPFKEKDSAKITAMMLGDVDKFEKEMMEPEQPDHSEEYFSAQRLGLYQLRQSLSTLEETLSVLELYTCPADATFEPQNSCATTKNVMSAILVSSLFISKRVYQAIEYLYIENGTVSAFDLNEMYQNVMSVHDNLDVLSGYAAVIRDNQQVLRDNQEVLSNQLKGIGGGGVSQKNSEEDKTLSTDIANKIDDTNALVLDVRLKLKSDLVNLNAGTKLHMDQKTDTILQQIENSCGQEPIARRRLDAECGSDGVVVECGFQPTGNKAMAVDKKSLFVEEGPRKVNTGFFYEVKNACSELVDVTVTILSNEVDERQSAFLTKVIQSAETAGESPRVYVAPRICKNEDDESPCPMDEAVCEPSPSGRRFYDLHVTAKDRETGDKVQDVCRVIVMPKKVFDPELRGGNSFALTEREQRELVDASPLRTVVGTLSLESRST